MLESRDRDQVLDHRRMYSFGMVESSVSQSPASVKTHPNEPVRPRAENSHTCTLNLKLYVSLHM
jgi:hypothetical protein